MTFEEWQATADPRLTVDRIWRMRAYRLACYLSDMAWDDAKTVSANRLTRDLGSQLLRALGAIRADLVEGYSRSGGRDRARFFEFALGSARESREWYAVVTPVLGEATASERRERASEIVRLLLAAIPLERKRKIEPGDPPDEP